MGPRKRGKRTHAQAAGRAFAPAAQRASIVSLLKRGHGKFMQAFGQRVSSLRGVSIEDAVAIQRYIQETAHAVPEETQHPLRVSASSPLLGTIESRSKMMFAKGAQVSGQPVCRMLKSQVPASRLISGIMQLTVMLSHASTLVRTHSSAAVRMVDRRRLDAPQRHRCRTARVAAKSDERSRPPLGMSMRVGSGEEWRPSQAWRR